MKLKKLMKEVEKVNDCLYNYFVSVELKKVEAFTPQLYVLSNNKDMFSVYFLGVKIADIIEYNTDEYDTFLGNVLGNMNVLLDSFGSPMVEYNCNSDEYYIQED